MKKFILPAISLLLAFTACNSDDDCGITITVPPQSAETAVVTTSLSLSAITRAAAANGDAGTVTLSWKEGDKVYLNYTKAFDDDEEVLNVFTLSTIDEDDPTRATFTCPAFCMPRGIESGNFVFMGDKQASSLTELRREAVDLSQQTQNGNGAVDAIAVYQRMTSQSFRIDSLGDLESLRHLRPSYSLITLNIKRPDHWSPQGQLGAVRLQLVSDNVTLIGTTDNTIMLTATNVVWNSDNMAQIHIVVAMDGIVNAGNTWKVTPIEAETGNEYTLTFAAKQIDFGKRYTGFVSSNPEDYESHVTIDIPGYEDGGAAW